MEEKSAKEKIITLQYGELNRFGTNAEYERALKCANKSMFLIFCYNMDINSFNYNVLSSWIESPRSSSFSKQNLLFYSTIKI